MNDSPPFALLLAAHGERRVGADNEGVARLALDLAGRGLAEEVGIGFIKGVPSIGETLRAFACHDVVVYPLFLSDGYFNRVRLPQLLAAAQQPPASARRLRILPPLGLDAALDDLVLRHAGAAAARAGYVGAALVLLAHGSSRDPASRHAAEALAERLGAVRRFAAVRCAFLEEPPSLADALMATPVPAVVIGLFAGEGLHGGADVPQLLGEIARNDVVFAGNIGAFAEIADIIARVVGGASTGGGGRVE